MIRLKDVAEKCGVSIATVSKALSDKKDIGDETKEYIKNVCAEMGYLPNSSARALKIKRSYNLGILLNEEDKSGLTHDYFLHIVEAFRLCAESHGYDITFISNGKGGNMSYLERARYIGVDGVLVACADYSQNGIMDLIQSDMPTVTIDHSFDNCSSVVSDNITGMRDLINYIYKKGHRHIAYIYGNNTAVTQNRVASYYRGLEDKGIDAPDNYVRASVYRNPDKAYKITMELLDLNTRPTCIIYPDDYSCIGGINAIKERGLKIPEDVSVAGYDGVYISQILDPKLTTVRQDTTAIGRCAAEKLVGLIESPKTSLIEKIVVEGQLLEGGSVGKI